ncbi:MAG: ABC transporter ATP-binding protein [Alkaliphilus sp.]
MSIKPLKSIVRSDDFCFKYTGRKLAALTNINLEILESETTLLLGPSGSGKSTLALSLNGLVPQKISGKVHGDMYISGMNTQEREIDVLTQEVGILFQDPEAQFVTMTVEHEIAFGLENLCIPQIEMDARIDESLSQVGMLHCRHRELDKLSGGEKQRVAIACLLAMRPKILVFDEPTANLDPIGTRQVFNTICELKKSNKYTIIIVEHKLDELIDLIDRLVVLAPNGTILADGSPYVVFNESIEDLLEHGVWLPQSVRLLYQIKELGTTISSIPVTLSDAEKILTNEILLTMGKEEDNSSSVHHPLDSSSKSTVYSLDPEKSSMSQTNAIEVKNLSFGYMDNAILNNIDLSITTGDFLAIVGANGAGKTTLVQLLVSVLQAKPNSIFIQGEDITKIHTKKLIQDIGFVFQNPEHQFITDSVENEVKYGLGLIGKSECEISDITHNLLSTFNLIKLAKANPFTLSHGEKRRLSVATMLAVGQKILILDEPTFGQDEKNALSLMQLLKQLNDKGCTVIMVTHDMTLVAEYAKHVAVMSSGNISYFGTPKDLFKKPNILSEANLALPPVASLSFRLQDKGHNSVDFITIADFLSQYQLSLKGMN